MMVAALDGMVLLMRDALRAWWHAASRQGTCAGCGTKTDPALDECLTCLAERHW